VPRVIGQTEQARQSKPARNAAWQSPKPCTADEFVETASDVMKKAVRELMPRSLAAGMEARFSRSEGQQDACYVYVAVPGVNRRPVTFEGPRIWINFGRSPDSPLRKKAVNQELRDLILNADQHATSAKNSERTAVAMKIERITTPAQWDTVGRILDLIARTLAPQGPVAQ